MKERVNCNTSSGTTGTYPYTTTTWYGDYYETCKCCCGSGVQRRCDGIKIICPCCGGSGKRYVRHPCPSPYHHDPFKKYIFCSSE